MSSSTESTSPPESASAATEASVEAVDVESTSEPPVMRSGPPPVDAEPSPAPTAITDDEETPSVADRPFLGLKRSDQVLVAVFLIAALVLSGIRWARMSGWGTEPVEIERQHPLPLEYKIDLNRAPWVELVQLPGIGEVLARRIIDDRESKGPFETVDELQRVKGIGPKTVEKIRRWLTVGQSGDDASPL